MAKHRKELKQGKQNRYRIIKEMSANYSVTLLCETAGVSRSGYYKWLKRQGMVTPKQKEDAYLKELILSCHQKMKGIYGYYRVKTWLLRQH